MNTIQQKGNILKFLIYLFGIVSTALTALVSLQNPFLKSLKLTLSETF